MTKRKRPRIPEVTEVIFIQPDERWMRFDDGRWVNIAIAGGIVYVNGVEAKRQGPYSLFSRALSPVEIAALYEAAKPSLETP